jgi:hypothetical protein
MELTREDIERWRAEAETIASDTRVPKRFRMSPAGHCVVIVGADEIYGGPDVDAAIELYNRA